MNSDIHSLCDLTSRKGSRRLELSAPFRRNPYPPNAAGSFIAPALINTYYRENACQRSYSFALAKLWKI